MDKKKPDGILTQKRYGEVKREVLKAFLQMLTDDLEGMNYDIDQKESMTVAKQCIEVAYDMEDVHTGGAVNLIEHFNELNIPPVGEDFQKLEEEAENYKVLGNNAMRDGDFKGAIEAYTKAISIFDRKAIYYCNRAAAFSRLDRHNEAIYDCETAIKMDPTYGKAYGRLGIAYSNLSRFKEAVAAYKHALELDPSNVSYRTNLKLAEEKIATQAPSAMNFDFSGFMNNPMLLNMASQMVNNPAFRNMVTGILSSEQGAADSSLDSFVEVGQQLAEQMQASNPEVLETLRASFVSIPGSGDGDPNLENTPHEPKEDDGDNNTH